MSKSIPGEKATRAPVSTMSVSLSSSFLIRVPHACIKTIPSPLICWRIKPSPPKNPAPNFLLNFIEISVPKAAHKKIIRKIISVDLEAVVKHADYLIVKWDTSVFRGGGTHGEVTMAYWLGKPVYLVNSLPIDDISSWIFSCSEEIFDGFESLKKRLEKIYC